MIQTTIKFRGMKKKVKTLNFNDIIDDKCFYSYPIVDIDDRPKSAKEYDDFVNQNIKLYDGPWVESNGFPGETDTVGDYHSHRIYIRLEE